MTFRHINSLNNTRHLSLDNVHKSHKIKLKRGRNENSFCICVLLTKLEINEDLPTKPFKKDVIAFSAVFYTTQYTHWCVCVYIVVKFDCI